MDIVDRLRAPATVFYEYAADDGAFLREAASEIEQLREDKKRGFELMDTFVREINRLRRELRRIASIEIDPDFGALPISDAQKIAQDALEDD